MLEIIIGVLGMLDLPNWNLMLFDSLREKVHDNKVMDAVG